VKRAMNQEPLSAADAIEAIRALLRTSDEGGAADYVRLADEDPIDHDEHARPMLAVAVADLQRVLDRVVPTLYLVRTQTTLAGGAGHTVNADTITRSGDVRDSRGRRLIAHYRRLDPLTRALLDDPDLTDAVLYRTSTPRRAVVYLPHVDVGVIAALVDTALRRHGGPATAHELQSMMRHRVTGGGDITRADVVAGLATLHAAGRVNLVAVGGPCYIAANPQVTDPPAEPVLSVLIAEHLSDVGVCGATVADIVDHLRRDYELCDQDEPGAARVSLVVGDLIAQRLAVQIELNGHFYAPEHSPI
jgi:hypothetical protein